MCSLSLITFLFLFPLYLCNPLTPSVHQIGIWEPCSTTPGTCIDTSSYSCTTSTLTGLCPGPVNVRCCPSPGGISFGSCASIGVCTRTSLCSTTTKTGLCPGPSGIKCCPFKKAPNIPPRKVIEDKPSGRDCSFYENIEKRGNKICTDKCRTFEIKDGYTESYLGNAFCACDVTPKNQLSARTVRSCLQRRLIDASRRGKTMWTRREIERDHVICYRAARCPCGPAFSAAWDIVTTVPISETFLDCSPVKISILIFGRCNKCTIDPPFLPAFRSCKLCAPGW